MAAALAHALGLPGADASWADPLPPLPAGSRRGRLAAELAWARRHLAPWAWQRWKRRAAAEGGVPKRPELRELRGGRGAMG
jgi:hypothetical protein